MLLRYSAGCSFGFDILLNIWILFCLFLAAGTFLLLRVWNPHSCRLSYPRWDPSKEDLIIGQDLTQPPSPRIWCLVSSSVPDTHTTFMFVCTLLLKNVAYFPTKTGRISG